MALDLNKIKTQEDLNNEMNNLVGADPAVFNAQTNQTDVLNNMVMGNSLPKTPTIPEISTPTTPVDSILDTNTSQTPENATVVIPTAPDGTPSKQSILFNTKTRKPEAVPAEYLDRAITSGAYTYKKGAQINVLDKDGKSFSVDSSELPKALQSGFTIENPTQQAIREYVTENQGLSGTAKVFLNQFVNQAAFGVPGVIQEHVGDDFERAKLNALKEDHAVSNIAGGIAGFGASIPLGGPIFKAASVAGQVAERAIANGLTKAGVEVGANGIAKNVVARITQKAANYGVQGAVISAPMAITEAALGDPESAAESLMLGGAFGVGLGGLGHVLTAGFNQAGKLVNFDKLHKFVDDLSSQSALKTIGFTPSTVNRLMQEGSEITGDRLTQIANNLRDKGIVKLGDSLESINTKIKTEHKRLGDLYDDTLKSLDDNLLKNPSLEGAAFNPVNVANKISSELIAPFEGISVQAGTVKLANEYVDDLLKLKTSALPFQKAIDFKNKLFFDYGRIAKKLPADLTEKDVITKKAYGIFVNEIENAAEKVFTRLGDTEGLSRFITNKQELRNFIDLERANNLKVAREYISGPGLSDNLTNIGAVGTGLTVGGLPGAISAAAIMGTKKLIDTYGNAASSDIMNKLSQTLGAMRETSKAGILIAEKANSEIGKKLDSVSNFFGKNKADKTRVRVSALGSIFLGPSEDKPDPKRDVELLDKWNKMLSAYESNGPASAAVLNTISMPFTQLGAPKVGKAYQDKVINTVKYLKSITPKPINPNNPFMKPVPFKPSDAQMNKFNRQLGVVMNPFSVVDRLSDGTLTKDEVVTLATVYPKVYQGITSRLTAFVSDPKNNGNVSYDQRLKLSMLFGTNLDPSLNPQTIATLQASFAPEQPQAPEPITSNQPLKIGQGQSLAKLPEGYMTATEKLAVS